MRGNRLGERPQNGSLAVFYSAKAACYKMRLVSKGLGHKGESNAGRQAFHFNRISRLCWSGRAIFQSKAQKKIRSFAVRDKAPHPAGSMSKTQLFDLPKESPYGLSFGMGITRRITFGQRTIRWLPRSAYRRPYPSIPAHNHHSCPERPFR